MILELIEETVKELIRLGARVVMASPDAFQAETVRGKILGDLNEIPELTDREGVADRVVTFSLDLGKLVSVREFAKTYKEKFGRLDMLLINADYICSTIK